MSGTAVVMQGET